MPEARYFRPMGPRGAVAALTLVMLLSPISDALYSAIASLSTKCSRSLMGPIIGRFQALPPCRNWVRFSRYQNTIHCLGGLRPVAFTQRL